MTVQDPVPVVKIRPLRGWASIHLGELWTYRELLYSLILRDVKIRYKQTVLGAAWAIIQPLFMMVIFTLFFGILARVPSGDVPYPLFTFTALLPWTFFAEALARSSNSLVQDAELVKKVYFPRLLLPVSGVLSPLIDLAIAFGLLIGLLVFYGRLPPVNIIFLPILVALGAGTALGAGLWLSALNARYRDFRHILPFLVQVWLFASPVIYSSDLVPLRFQAIYGLNPMAGVIEGFRWVVLGGEAPVYLMTVSTVIAALLLVTGAYYFRRAEQGFADVI